MDSIFVLWASLRFAELDLRRLLDFAFLYFFDLSRDRLEDDRDDEVERLRLDFLCLSWDLRDLDEERDEDERFRCLETRFRLLSDDDRDDADEEERLRLIFQYIYDTKINNYVSEHAFNMKWSTESFF